MKGVRKQERVAMTPDDATTNVPIRTPRNMNRR